MLTSDKGYTPQTSWQSRERVFFPENTFSLFSPPRAAEASGVCFSLSFLFSASKTQFNFTVTGKWIHLRRHSPALQAQEPSTGEQVAPFLQLHTEEQFTPYVPGRQGVPQDAPWIIKEESKKSLKTNWGGSENTTDSSDTKASKNTAHACPRLSLNYL